MPILDVEIVGGADDVPANLAQLIADAAGAALNSRRNGTWVKLKFVPEAMYAENGGGVDQPPVIVTVVQAEPPSGVELKSQMARLADAIGEVTGRKRASVHILCEPPAKGRIAFGGVLVE